MGPTDQRLLRLFEDHETSITLDDLRPYLTENKGDTTALLACYLLTDSDPKIVELLKQCPPNELVMSLLPFWSDQMAANEVRTNYRTREDWGKDTTLTRLNKLGDREGEEARELIREISGGEEINFREFSELEQHMRNALGSLNIHGTSAEILVLQKSPPASGTASKLAYDLKTLWSKEAKNTSKDDRAKFTIECLEVLWKLKLPQGETSPNLLRVQADLADNLSQTDVLFESQTPNIYAAELRAEADTLESKMDEINEAFRTLSGSNLDKYCDLYRSDPSAAKEFLLSGSR